EDAMVRADDGAEWRRAAEWPELARYFALRKKTAVAASKAPVPGAPSVVTCWQHPSTPGRWLCGTCGATSCDACVVNKTVARVTLRACARCEGLLNELVPTKVIVPFWKDVPQLLAYPVRNGAWIGLILCAIVAVMAWIAGHVPMYGRLAATILTFSIYAY